MKANLPSRFGEACGSPLGPVCTELSLRGHAVVVNEAERLHGLKLLMDAARGRVWTFPEEKLKLTEVVRMMTKGAPADKKKGPQ